MRLGGGLDVPGDQARTEGISQLLGEHGLAGTGFALDQQRPLQSNGGVDCQFEIVSGDVRLGTLEFHQDHPQTGAPEQNPAVQYLQGVDYTAQGGACERTWLIQALNDCHAEHGN